MHKRIHYKLLLIASVALFLLMDYRNLLHTEPQILSRYDLISVIITAASLGVILSAIFYNLAIYLSMREKQYLYYALAQSSVLLFLFTLEGLFIEPFYSLYPQSMRLHALGYVGIVIFSMLFIRSFLDIRPNTPLDRYIRYVIYLTALDIPLIFLTGEHLILKFIPPFLLIWLIVSEAYPMLSHRRYLIPSSPLKETETA